MDNIFITLIVWLLAFVACITLVEVVCLAFRQIEALWNKDNDEFNRLTTPYDIASLEALRDFGIPEDVFEKTWGELKDSNPDALPYDVYLYFRNCNEKGL